MKNIPNRIYLQVDPENEKPESFNELSEITWCIDKINNNDIPYYRHNKSSRVESEVIKKITEIILDKKNQMQIDLNKLKLNEQNNKTILQKHLLIHGQLVLKVILEKIESNFSL